MILKSSHKTQHLKQLEIMQDRLLNMSPINAEKFGRELAGYLGERALPYYVHLTNITSHYDLYGLRLEWNGHHFQLDGLFLFPNFLLITEVKHLKGKLSINEANQLVQVKEIEEKVYPHPLQQANLQKKQLTALLSDLGYDTIPIHTIVVFTHQEANLSIRHPDIIPIQQFPFRLNELVRNHTDKHLEMDQLLQLGKQLMDKHNEKSISFLKRDVDVLRNVRRGVFCPNCKTKIMKRTHGKWICLTCSYTDRNAHISALIDYTYLFGSTITNKQLRWFLFIDSKFTATRILKELQLSAYGNTKSRKYNLQSLARRRN